MTLGLVLYKHRVIHRFKNRTTEGFGIVLALLAMLLFSMVDGIWKHALVTTPIAVLFCVNYAVALLGLAAYARVTRASLRPRRPARMPIYIALYALELGTFAYALNHVPLVELFVIVLTTPLFVLICAHLLLHERLAAAQILSILSGFAGALMVIAARMTLDIPEPAAATGNAVGLAFAVANVVFGGCKIIFLRKYCQDENVIGLGFWTALAFAGGAAIIAGPTLLHIPSPILALLCCGGILSQLGQIAFLRAAQIARAPLMAATQYSQIVWAMLMGTFIFAEPLTWPALAGTALIIASGILLYGRYLKK